MVFVGLLVQCLFSAGRRRQQTGLAPFFEAVAFASDVDDGGVVQQLIQHSRRQDCIAKGAAPVAKAFIPYRVNTPQLAANREARSASGAKRTFQLQRICP